MWSKFYLLGIIERRDIENMENTIHNPDRFMVDLRQILSQGRKRIGLLIGAGAPTALKINSDGKLSDDGQPIIPDVAGLTSLVINGLEKPDKAIVSKLVADLGSDPNIEAILTKTRKLSLAIGNELIHGLDSSGYNLLAEKICKKIGKIVDPNLPEEPNPYSELVSWIGGTHREHAVEIFTPNYDLLLEEAFERNKTPYYDGFSGSCLPFFDPISIEDEELPSSWSKLWKLHGSLGWEINGEDVIRTGNRNATTLIYPDHLKYDHIARQPYSSLFERLKKFLTKPDTILMCSGFSFFDAHIRTVLEEALFHNKHTAIFAFQYRCLEEESLAVNLAMKRPNLSVYARDGAVVYGVPGKWQPGEPPTDGWSNIRKTFWDSSDNSFILGDFAKLARFFSLAQASDMKSSINDNEEDAKEIPLAPGTDA